jgi:hypothetical protein
MLVFASGARTSQAGKIRGECALYVMGNVGGNACRTGVFRKERTGAKP